MPLPMVAIVGRPNVGKSTLFNRLVRKREAIINNQPGVTRDRLYGLCTLEERPFTIIDTGGFELDSKEELTQQMREQTEIAIQEADLVVYLMDAKEGLLDLDREIIRLLYKANKKMLLVVNKADGPSTPIQDFYALGNSFLTISAEHALGIGDLVSEIIKELPIAPPPAMPQVEENSIRLAIIGRPNVGKSSLINSLLRQKRMVVTDIPGTTRDSVDSHLLYNDRSYTLIDTAGIRRKGKTTLVLEKYSVISALKHLETCDIAIILIDAADGVTSQDVTIAGYAFEAAKPCLLVMNKWDLITKDHTTQKLYEDKIRYEIKYLSYAPILFVSALTGQHVFKLFPYLETLYAQYTKKISTRQLNTAMAQIVQEKSPPFHRGKQLKFYYQTQISIKPPTFLFFVNYPEGMHFSYERYLHNQIRTLFGLENIPIRIFFRKREKSPSRKHHS